MQVLLNSIVTRMFPVGQLPVPFISWLLLTFALVTWNHPSLAAAISELASNRAESEHTISPPSSSTSDNSNTGTPVKPEETVDSNKPSHEDAIPVVNQTTQPAPQEPAPQETMPERAANLPAGINDGFLNPDMDPEEYIQRFEVESREVFACRHDILDALELKAGARVGDIGAGTGLFMKPFSEQVGKDGLIYAVEIAPSFVKHLRIRARTEQLQNVEVVFCSDRHANLRKNSVDRLFLCDVYHHFEYPQATMDSLFEAMRDGGMLVLIDFHREPVGVSPERTEWLRGHVRASQEVFRAEIEKSGFQFKDEITIKGFQENYLLRFIKPESGGKSP